MDFLGNQSSEIRKMKAQVLALEALNLALIEALRPELREQLQKRFECYSEKMKTQMLNSMVTDELYGACSNPWTVTSKASNRPPTSKPKSACKQTFITTTVLTALPSLLCKAV